MGLDVIVTKFILYFSHPCHLAIVILKPVPSTWVSITVSASGKMLMRTLAFFESLIETLNLKLTHLL